jgi:hypothetical protein
MKRMIAFVVPACFIFSCSQLVKKNYYIEIKESKPGLLGAGFTTDYSKDTIQEVNDSAAYAHAFSLFCSSAKIYKQIKATSILGKPVSFKVYNDHYDEITNTIPDSLKRKIETIELEQYIKINYNKGSIYGIINALKRIEYIANDIEVLYKNSLFDTVGLYAAPVKVLGARLISRDYSSYKDIRLTYKNISTKAISAIRFKWYGINSFNEPADMGSSSLQEGFGSGFADDRLPPGKTDSGTWSIMSKDGKKVVLAWPYEVAFEDGTKWELNGGNF